MLAETTLGEFLVGANCAIATVVNIQTFALPAGRFRAASRIRMKLDHPLLGDWAKEFDVDVIGGTVGDITVEVEDQPLPKPGKQLLVRVDSQLRGPFRSHLLGPGTRTSGKVWEEASREIRERAAGKRKDKRTTNEAWSVKPLGRSVREFITPHKDPIWPGTYPTTVTLEIWDNTSDLGAEDAYGAIQRAVNSWNSAGSNFSIRHVARAGGLGASTTDKRMIVRWSPTGAPNVLATTTTTYITASNTLIDADIQFWDNNAWSTSPTSGQYDIESVAVHELGHFLGLPHSSGSNDVMQPSIGSGVQRRALSSGDISAIQGLYGARPVGDFIVYRWWNGRDHFYTTQVYSELAPDVGYTYEGAPFRLFASGTANTTRLFRWYHPGSGDHFYTTDPNGELAPVAGYMYEGSAGNIATSQIAGTVPLFRWYHPSSGDHFYTTDPNGELAPVAGYQAEGQAGFVRLP